MSCHYNNKNAKGRRREVDKNGEVLSSLCRVGAGSAVAVSWMGSPSPAKEVANRQWATVGRGIWGAVPIKSKASGFSEDCGNCKFTNLESSAYRLEIYLVLFLVWKSFDFRVYNLATVLCSCRFWPCLHRHNQGQYPLREVAGAHIFYMDICGPPFIHLKS